MNTYRELLEITNDLVWELDKNYDVTFVADGIIDALGYEVDEVVGNQIFSYLSKESNESFSELLKKNKRKTITSFQVNFICKSNREVLYEISCVPFFDNGNKLSGYVCQGVDVAQKERDRLDYRRMKRQLLQSTKLATIGELAATVVHEINNPLAIIMGNVEVIEESLNTSGSSLLKQVSKIHKSVHRIANIVNGLRTYARSNPEVVEKVSLQEIIGETVDLIENIYKKDRIAIEKVFKCADDNIWGNGAKLQQVIINLFSNAKDAMLGKGGRIKIETSDGNESIILKISDNGHGVEKKNIKKIFDSFYTTKSSEKGTGLGLSISKSIIDDMHGSIDVDSEDSVGTTFIIKLDKYKSEMDGHMEKSEKDKYEKINGRALIVDDEEDIGELLAFHLEKFGLDVDLAIDGESAIAKVKEGQYDIIITDLRMPKMTGDILVTELRKLCVEETRIFVMSGGIFSDYTDNQIKVIREMVTGYIKKPFSKDDIYKALTADLATLEKEKK